MKFFRFLAIVIGIMLLIAIMGIGYRVAADRKLRRVTNQQAITNVSTMKATAESPNEEIVLPANVTAWHDSTIFARVNGYEINWLVDIGDRVKVGDLLAVISAPEVDAQLHQAEADLKTAQANYEIAHITAVRWRNLVKTESVSVQENEEKTSSEKATAEIVDSTRANRDRLLAMVNFERIIAPYDGVITSRTTDIGRLINAGSSTVPLFRIEQINRLRIYVDIPQYYSTSITPDFTVQLYFAEHPSKIYPAKLINTAKAIDPSTRTLLAEFAVDNANYELLAGSYTQMHLLLPVNKNYVILPVNTLIFRSQGMQVASVDRNNKVIFKPITIGRDFGDTVEVVAGIKPGELVIINPSDSLNAGAKVHIVKQKA